jgi:STE24 endopeptidase
MNSYRRIPAEPADWFSPDEVRKAKDYQRPLTRLRIAGAVTTLAVIVVLISTHAAPRIADALGATNWILRLIVVLAGLIAVFQVVDLPFEVWREFAHEKRWEFSTQTPGRFVGDQVKEVLMSVVLLAVMLLPMWALIRSTSLWWLAAWGVFFLFGVILNFLGPVLILPLFNKFEPLEDEAVVHDLQGLATSAGLRISGVQVMDASKRTRKDNAFFAGMGKTRRVVLFDNILEQPRTAIRAVVAHELGHWRRKHLRQGLVFGTVLSFGMFALLRVVSTWRPALDWAGVRSIADPASLPLVLVVLVGGQVVLGYLRAWQSRALEREADIEALELTQDRPAFQDMMRNLATKNLGELAPSRLTYLRMDHPPAAERLQLAETWSTQQRARSAKEG